MRFKSRLFPLIDVMILMLGLFIIILAKAQLTVETQSPEAAVGIDRDGDTQPPGVFHGISVSYAPGLGAWRLEDGTQLTSEADWLALLAERQWDAREVIVTFRLPASYDSRARRSEVERMIGLNAQAISFELLNE